LRSPQQKVSIFLETFCCGEAKLASPTVDIVHNEHVQKRKSKKMNSNNELMLDVGQANEIKLALRREGGWTNEEIKALCERRGLLSHVREVLLGRAEIKPVEHVIDLDADPYVPNNWSVEEHIKGGQMKWDPTRVRFHLSNGQKKNGNVIEGNKLRKEIAKLSGYNANLLDFLLKKENQHLIPEEWKQDEKGNTRYIYFWGTIYRDSDGDLCVRYLCWFGTRWDWSCYWLGDDWYDNGPALVPAS